VCPPGADLRSAVPVGQMRVTPTGWFGLFSQVDNYIASLL
jgi:hypothetical protein